MKSLGWWRVGLVVLALVPMSGCVVTVEGGAEEASDRRLEKKGWVKLGERLVNGKGDKDRILVGKVEGRFRRVMIVVEHSSIELYDMDIEFADGSHHSPNLKARFGENERSRQIDLPGTARAIRDVTFKYGNLPGGGAATVELWGLP